MKSYLNLHKKFYQQRDSPHTKFLITPNQDTNVTLRGNFTIHGVSRPVTARTRVKWDGGTRLQGRSQFTVKLEDHGIDIPAIVEAKVSNEIAVRIDFQAST